MIKKLALSISCLFILTFYPAVSQAVTCQTGYIEYNGSCYKKLACENGGTQKAGACVCKNGWVGTLCQTAKACTGYDYIKCPTGYLVSSSCMSGDTKKLKCGKCATGYVKQGTKCYKKLSCQNGGTQEANTCVCKDGWEGTLCQTAKTCAGYVRTSCPSGYLVNTSCTSGNTQYVKCKINPCTGYAWTKCPTGHLASASCMSGKTKKLKCGKCTSGYVRTEGRCYKKLDCKNGGTQKASKCVCKDGWEGTLCQTAKKCTGFTKTSCSTGYVVSESCMSGNKKYVKCKVNPCTGYAWTTCPTGHLPSASCMSGKTKKLKCGKCTSGYVRTEGRCYKKLDCKNGGTQKANTCVCKDGWEGTLCQTAKTCAGYDYTACPTGYAASASCMSGTVQKLKCGNCASGYIKQSSKCYKDLACKNGGTQSANKCVCKEGWIGTNCGTKATCAYNTTSCTGGYEETGNTCKSGNITYRECKAKAVPSGYTKNKCTAGYTQEATFLSGTTTYYKCTANKCDGYVKSCSAGYVPTSDTCLSATTTMYKCAVNPCTGYSAACPKDYYVVVGDTCQSGTVIMYKCKTDLTDFDNGSPIVKKELTEDDNVVTWDDGEGNQDITTVNNEDLKVVTRAENTVTGVLSTQDEVANAYADEGSKIVTVDIEQRGNGDVYGMRAELGDDVGDGLDVDNTLSAGTADVTSTIKIKNKGNGNTYGMYTNADISDPKNEGIYMSNVWADIESEGTGVIDITSQGNGDVYGMFADETSDTGKNIETINAQADEKAVGSGIIKINKIGNGDVYGMKAKSWAVNASAHGQDEIVNQSTANGVININQSGNGNVYGIYADRAINASTGGGKETSGLIRIYGSNDTAKNSNIYGIVGKTIDNAVSDDGKKASGIINIIVENTKEHNADNDNIIKAYGMYSDVVGNRINNISEGLVSSIIEMANIYENSKYADIIGIYSNNGTINNSGNILLHNLSYGHAYGIKADNATVYNSGDIVVDNSDFVDNMATEDEGDDVTYTVSNVDWQNNYGLYVKDSEITNSGTITVSNDKSAEGILIDGGTVTNNGTINVSGNSGAIGISSYLGETGSPTIINNGIINVSGSGNVYGIDANAGNITNNNEINVVVEGTAWNVYGMSSSSMMVSLLNEGSISINNKSDADVCGMAGTNNGTIDITNVGDGNITGVDIWDNDVEIGQGTININNEGNGNVTGIYPAVQPYDYEQAKHSGSVFIHNKGNGKVSDGVATESEIYNKGAGSIETYALSSIVHNTGDASISTSSNNSEIYNEGNGNISISGVTQSYVENTGDGNIEIQALNSVVYNTGNGRISTSSDNEEIHNEGDGDIVVDGGENVKIDNNGDGNISGNFFVQNLIIRNVGNGDIFGATGVEYGYGAGTISTAITNTGTGSAYGFWSDANYFDSDNDIAVSLVSEGSGNAYGMYFDGLNNNTYNINSNIKMANKADGFAVGLYAKDSNITNTGDITIHNLGSGTAVGIFAEGTSNIVNSGNITIDRKSFLDENTFSGEKIIYSADSETGGKAVGIYGSGKTTITNTEDGVIKIMGASKGIGIYSEGGNVYNYGTIILDNKECAGAVCESVQNAIRLYGGKLFQEGKMVADANWDSAPNDPRGVIGTLNNVNNSNLSVSNYNAERNVFGMLNDNEHYVSNALIETDNQEAQISILNQGNGHVYGVYGHYVTNADVIANSGRGFVFIENEGNGDVYGLAGFKQSAFAGEEWGASNTDIVDKNAPLRGDVSARALINITNIGSGHIYGLFAELADKEDSKIGNAQNAYGGSTAEIVIDNTNTTTTRSNVYGIYADEAVNATSFAQNEANGVIDITNIGKSDIYGVYGKKVKNAEAKNGDKAVAKGDISIYNIGVGDVIGINGSVFNSDETAHNSWVESADSAIGNINITNKYGNVYGIKGDGLVHNAEARNNGEAKGRIEISDIEGGNIYGIAADSVYNAQSGYYHGNDGNFDILSAHGVVSINSNSNGNVYGLKANSRAYNVKADDGYATGIIRVSYNGEGNAYGIWSNGRAAGDEIASYNASINNAYNSCVGSDDCSKGTAWANGQIIMINKNSGNAYAMYSVATGNMILNTNRVNFGKGVSSIISIGNVGDGLSVAMYSKNGVIENTGDIKIQNIANGTAIGLYADGNTRVINTGNITIDHRKIIDDNATPEGDDDVLYSPAEDNEVSGRAIGIYGAADSSIYNSGTIVIDGAKEAYGIYSEGGDVENIGDVVIDGRVTENSIRLNGGKLLQNGVLIAGADWNDNGQSGSYNCVNGEWNGKECVCNQGWSGVACDEANSCPRKYTTMDCVEGYHADPDDICWSGNTPMHVCVADECPEQYTADRCQAGYHADMKDTCMSGGMELHACVPDECEGYEYQEKCPAGYQIVDSCLAGDITMVNCKEIIVDDALVGSIETSNNSDIYLNNEDKRDVYGMYNVGGSIYNSSITDSTGIININNVSGNSVYGMYSGDEGRATNANNGNGIIRIGNTGDGNVYGIQSGYIQNATRNNGNETGKVIVVNNGSGNAYGLHGKKVYSETNEDRNQYSEIEMANRGDGLAVGMYGTEYVKNSGAITIHNLGNGTAIGMYGDEGAEIDNTGIITIDRSSYTDHVNIIPSRSDPTYSADTETGGKAIGIYGAADTEIDNDGIINISGTADAYGIWSEGGDVENDGIIIINGNENSANAIRLNAGILFQNGILIAEPEWSNIVDDYIDPESEENWDYIANNTVIPSITQNSSDDMVGFEGNRRTVINAFAYPKDASGSIEVTQDGSGSVYGIRGLAGDSNDEEDQEVYNAVSYGANTATGTIRVTNTGNGEGAVYGMYGSNEDMFVGNATNDEIYAQEGLQSTGTIEIVSSGNKNVYGIYSNEEAINAESDEIGTVNGTISIENTGTGDVYGLRAHDRAYNADATEAAGATGHINISNNGSGDVYGMFSERSDIFNSAAGHDRGLGQTKDSSYTYGLVNVYNNGKGSTYGMKGVLENDWNKSIFNARAAFNGEATGRVRVVNLSDGNLYGIYGTDLHNADVGGTLNREYNPSATGIINVISAEGKAYGMYGRYIYNQSDANRSSTIEMTNTGNGLAVGMYAQNGYINNSGDIIIHNLGRGKAVGIMAEGSTGVYNSGNITIDRESYYDDLGKQTYSAPDNALYGGTAIGIYGGEGTSITNSGTITINKASTAFGIWSAGGNVVNTGSISIDGSKCTGDACLSATNAIILNGGTLFQDGELRVSEIVAPGTGNNRSAPATTEEEIPTPTRSRGLASLNLNDFGGTVVASSTSQFIAEGSISGDLAINNNVIDSGFNTTYTVADMIQAGDVSGLNLISQSALFDASLENGTDAVMTMKSFNEVVNNQSLADFLKQNYDAENNETFFNMLKNHETVVALNETLNSIIGNEVFNRFNFEDMTMMRELNMDVNNTLFNNNDDNLITSGNIAPFYFDSENGAAGKYALYNRRIGKKSFGLSLAFSNVNSRDRKDNNSREDESFQMSVPFGYKAHGFKFITAPRFGYAYGHYDRDGFENTVYKGTMEKRMFGLMNEVRYPIKLGGWKIAPAAEFNMLGYHLKGGESAQAYSLNIKSQNNYSVETGLGIYANREFKPSKNSVLNFNAGVAAYHEFADPYTVELGMHDMNGSFKLRDERRKDNRAVVRTGFDYSYGDITLEGSFATFVDGITHTRAGVDLRYNF